MAQLLDFRTHCELASALWGGALGRVKPRRLRISFGSLNVVRPEGQMITLFRRARVSVPITDDLCSKVIFVLLTMMLVERAGALNLQQYRLESIETHDLGSRRRVKGVSEYHLYNNVLHIDGLARPVLLGRSAVEPGFRGTAAERVGFNPETLQLRWLHREDFLWISWKTYSIGQGRYSQAGHVLLLIEGTEFAEIFRDSIYANGCAGGFDCSGRSLDFAYDSGKQVLALTTEQADTSSSPIEIRCDPRTHYGKSWSKETRRYNLRKKALQFIGGERSVRFEGRCRITDIARLLQLPRRQLERLNRWQRNQRDAEGWIKVTTDLGPYRPEHHDGICHDKPCA